MKPMHGFLVVGAAATMLTAGWRAGAQPLPSFDFAQPAVAPTSTVVPGPTASPAASPAPTPAGTASTPSTTPATTATTKPATKPATTPTTKPATKPAAPPAPAKPSGTFVGSKVNTSYGPMQVQIVVSNGTITAVQPLAIGYGDSESRRINAAAVPTLQQRVLSAQSSNVKYVSGASYTSQGFLASVKSAMAKAGI